LARSLKGESCLSKARPPELSLGICRAKRFAHGCKFGTYLSETRATLTTPRCEPSPTLVAERCDSIHRFAQQLIAPSLLTGECGEAALLWTQRREDLLNARTILGCLFHFRLCSRTPSFMACRTGELFNERAALFGAKAERLINRTLPDKEEAILSEPCTVKQFI
jgi:hypothetical protein